MAEHEANRPSIDVSLLPDASLTEIDFRDTSFFQSKGTEQAELPSPEEIIQQYPDLRGRGIAKFEQLNLVVKTDHSNYLRTEEALTLRAIRQAFPSNEVPVPEVFGWRKVGTRVYIYMGLVSGKTLRQAWDSLTSTDKASIRDQLSQIIAALRRITQGSPARFIGSVNGGHVQDRFFKLDYEEGPFFSIKSFNDWMGAAATRQKPGQEGFQRDVYRDFVADTGEIYFTHGDLTLGNIIISDGDSPRRIVGIIDWEQAGWYPEYWEYCKLLYAVDYEHGWRSEGWAEQVMKQYEEEWEAFGEYSHWRGCP
ncbi:hypothetical protein GGTG_13852 [Gaeumannomyces tritici R3-111a-1]|uniref:Aminoglycoside phosphotransferase domain-containing protein n=1 Tax=Gaeumannomyces tritici (strain R3-111a-1) TaxID=644352 RepID=J3PK07_GAET3|nr:hypothetical protein GGTG_13852 [Gaeumannomyces tritici R3-111a-1]EJT68577.1 hypothetical protein GGTG_13852 [Gaeumannomyces tritici R3-111a-1]